MTTNIQRIDLLDKKERIYALLNLAITDIYNAEAQDEIPHNADTAIIMAMEILDTIKVFD